MLEKAIKLATLSVLVLFAGCEKDQAAKSSAESAKPGDTACKSIPFLEHEDYWGSHQGKVTVNCNFEQCFPKNLEAQLPCDLRCLFGNQGGAPEAISRAFAGKTPVKKGVVPNFIVAYGPPASGKDSVLSVLERRLGDEFKNLGASIVSVDVDDIFQGGEVGKSYEKYRNAIIAKADSPQTRTLYTQRLYSYYRWAADQISDEILNEALAARYHVLWETTGASLWPRREIARTNSYGFNTIVVYPFVGTEELIERAKKRAQVQGQEAAPPDQIRMAVGYAQSNLIELLPERSGIHPEGCPISERFNGNNSGICRANRIILIDNTGEIGQEQIAFDSKRAHAFCGNLDVLDSIVKLSENLKIKLTEFAKCK